MMKGGSLDWRQYMMIGDYVWFVPLDTSNHECEYTWCKYYLNCFHSQQIGTNAYILIPLTSKHSQHLQYCGVVICFLPLVLLLVWFASNFLCHRGDLEGQNQSLCWQSCEIRTSHFRPLYRTRQLLQRAGGWGALSAPTKWADWKLGRIGQLGNDSWDFC